MPAASRAKRLATRQGRLHLRQHVKAIFETTVSSRLQDAEQISLLQESGIEQIYDDLQHIAELMRVARIDPTMPDDAGDG